MAHLGFLACGLKRAVMHPAVPEAGSRSVGAYCASAVVQDFDAHPYGCFGQQPFHELRPLDEADGAGVEVFFVSHVIDFFNMPDAIEVEVVNRCAVCGRAVFIDDGKCRRVYRVGYA